ncbi:hypothetical protein F2P81_023658 [Scophthalmus maximus]|uniref:Uncharacterized protein n=1 Tax=Scophthalmus maximus TaxID=52904 RepID=A0A6A4RQE0_SCOMX|nr:hypothetical protein F2P81_023658 [Scophthalmus maximus]
MLMFDRQYFRYSAESAYVVFFSKAPEKVRAQVYAFYFEGYMRTLPVAFNIFSADLMQLIPDHQAHQHPPVSADSVPYQQSLHLEIQQSATDALSSGQPSPATPYRNGKDRDRNRDATDNNAINSRRPVVFSSTCISHPIPSLSPLSSWATCLKLKKPHNSFGFIPESHRSMQQHTSQLLFESTDQQMIDHSIAYKEKMKEISVLSLICSCLYPETRKNILGDFEDLDIKPINKRASGQAFEVILKPSSPVSDTAHCITSPPKRDISLEDIQKKLEAAEDRRRSQEAQVLRALAEKREHERLVLLKAEEENSNFSRMAEEKLQLKMEQIEENRMAYLAAIMDRLQEKVSSMM